MKKEKLPDNNLTSEERDKLVVDNLNLVGYFVNKICYDYNYKDDAFQEGVMGLMRAARLYDASRDHSFSSFAAFEIQCAIRDFMYRNRLIKLPDEQRSAINKYKTKIRKLEVSEVVITSDIISATAKEFGLKQCVLNELLYPEYSLDQPYNAGTAEEYTLADTVVGANLGINEIISPEDASDLINYIEQFLTSFYEVDEDNNCFIKTEDDELVEEQFRVFLKRSLGEEFTPVLEILRERYPQYKVLDSDSEEVAKQKRKALDNIYCRVNGTFNARKKLLAKVIKEHGYRLGFC